MSIAEKVVPSDPLELEHVSEPRTQKNKTGGQAEITTENDFQSIGVM